MNILISVSDLSIGGAQIFAVRLAIALSQNHSVYIYNHELFQKHNTSRLLQELPHNIKTIYLPSRLNWLAIKADALLLRFKINAQIRRIIRFLYFRAIIHFYNINIINSHLYPSDQFVVNALKSYKIPIIMTDHGEYRYVIEEKISTLEEVHKIANRVNGIVYCSRSNEEIFSKYIKEYKPLERIIYYGFFRENKRNITNCARENLGIPKSSFVFGMVARGIPEKGWNEAIQAFKSILYVSDVSKKDIHLILVGESDYLCSLKDSLEPRLKSVIHFIGYSSEPDYWIDAFNVAMLPTYFFGESLPNSIIEYLSFGKPVIATDIGGIPEMINHNGETAGFLVSLSEDGKADTSILADKMFMYINDSSLLESHSRLAMQAFEKFKMQNCVESYEFFFKEILNIS
ncbi:glycosyltransferase family 4 protein [Anabaena subtropica]|uniref:Glycosyltransferase family 4 protein n=1 Tax=Anabaena subtropica FACHB-260 TaxID=2692884 RepID=A0ABR8CLT0_9NOST|nr:glycosyltransferase family 4 protein [Anabaena subtropica]MBD2343415.1 glycosyltransferase family 4 protein [Anabaena subtropica FACHB-260]